MSTREAPADAKMPVQRGRPTSKGLPKGVSVCFRLDFDYLEPNRPHRKRRAPRGGSESPDPPWLALSVPRALGDQHSGIVRLFEVV